MELRALEYFLAVAREENITEASNVLHVSQPTLSRQIADLEEELGKKLFVRTNRNTFLTEDGVRLRQRAEEILSLVDKASEELREDSSDEFSGTIRIGAAETALMRHVTDIFSDLRKQHPRIQFMIYSGNADDVEEKLDHGLLDFGILMEPVNRRRYEHIYLPGSDHMGILMRKDAPFAGMDSITPAELPNIPLLISSREANTIFDVENWSGGRLRLDHLRLVGRFNLLRNASYLVDAGIAGAMTIDHLMDTGAGDLTFIPLDPPVEIRSLLVWKKHQFFQKAAELFLEHAKEAFR